MYDALNASAQQQRGLLGNYDNESPIDVSKLSAILDRVRQSVGIADGARSNFGAELDRLLGCVPTAVGNKPVDPRLNNGVIGDLDDAISDLINTLEIINGQSHRFASV